MMTDTILIITQHAHLRQSLRDWLALHLPWCHILGAADAAEAGSLSQGRPVRAFIVDLDGGRGNGNGLEALRQLRAAMPETPLIALGLDESPTLRAAATEAGATAYLSKSGLPGELLPLLKQLFTSTGETR